MTPEINKQKIVIVEDEAITALDIRRMLEKEGFEVMATVGNSEEAMEAVKSHKPDLVLMDIMLSGETDGIETAQEIYQSFHIPVIYLTASTDASTIKRADNGKHYGYIIKPVNRNDLHMIISSALKRHYLEDRGANST